MPDRRRVRGSRQSSQGGGTSPAVHVHTGGSASEREDRRSRPVTTEEIDSFTMRLVGRHGTTEAALTRLAGEQLKYRRRAQDAEAEAEELRGQLPGSDDLILKGDEAKEYKALKTSDPKFSLVGLGTSLKELTDLRSNTAKTTRAGELTTAAGTKYKKSLLAKLIGDLPLQFKPKLVPKADDPNETEEIQVPFVKVGDTLLALDTWLEQEHKDLLDALKVPEGEQQEGTQQQQRTDTQQRPAATMPKQTPSNTGSAPKGKDKELLAVVDKTLGVHMSPGMRRKEAAGGK